MRTTYCGLLNISHVGLEVVLCGWVNKRRNFGRMIFIDMRDREGNIQIVFDSHCSQDVFMCAAKLRNEFCFQVTGLVRARPNGQFNSNIKTGNIEVLATAIEIINSSEPLPVDLEYINSEEQRLRYRYLDLRRPIMLQRLKNRSRVVHFIHHFMEKNGFLNIETPILTYSTSEGARDYLVPSRLHRGKFYALPQSPQLFKQLLMISGFDRYYQITKCFRDEDLRADRQPEFTQIDIETSFMNAEEVREITECLIRNLWSEILQVELGRFSQITYKESLYRFGSDSPDLRNPIEMVDISDLISDRIKHNLCFLLKCSSSLKLSVIRVPFGAKLDLSSLNEYINFFKVCGGQDLMWMKIAGYGKSRKIEGSVLQMFDSEILENILYRTGFFEYDLFLFLFSIDNQYLYSARSSLRLKLGNDLGLIKENCWEPVWITDFPMFKNNDNGDIVSMHHLFTAPKDVNLHVLLKNPLSVIANSYDMVINGYEVASGSVRIHSYEIQKAVLSVLGFDEILQRKKFGFFLDALKFGAPIHAGIAFGLDRLLMLLNNTSNIRDVIAFPKTTSASDLMTCAPDFPDPKILCDL